MSSWDHVHNLMIDVGEILALDEVTEFAEERAWRLIGRFGGVVADYVEDGDRLLLTAPFATWPVDPSDAELETLLLMSGEALDPRDLKAGLDTSANELVLMTELPAGGLEARVLSAALERLGAAIDPWRARIEESRRAATRSSAGQLPAGEMLIRG